MKKSDMIHGGILAALILGAWGLLGGDVIPFLSWWLVLVVLGLGFWPATSRIFQGFSDQGWLFSKVLGIAVTGYLMWLLNVTKLVKFRNGACVAVAVICIGINFLWMKKKRVENPGRQEVDFYRRMYFPGHVSPMDLSGRIPTWSSRHGKVYGLWFYGHNDAQRLYACPGYVVCR